MSRDKNPTPEIAATPLTDEQRYYYELSYKEPADSIGRIEEMAKFLVGAVSATSGLVLAALGLALGDTRAGGGWFYAPVLLWSASVLLLVLVLLPRRYTAGQREPEAWKQTLLSSRALQVQVPAGRRRPVRPGPAGRDRAAGPRRNQRRRLTGSSVP